MTKLPDDASANPKIAVSGTVRGISVTGSGTMQVNPDGSWTASTDLKADGDGADILPGKNPKLRLNADPDDEEDGDDTDDIGGSVDFDRGPYGKGSTPLVH